MLMILIYVVLALIGIYALFSVVRSQSNLTVNPHARPEKSPEEMKGPGYRPFKDGPFQMTMGLKSMPMQEWIEIDPAYRTQIGLKKELLKSPRRHDLLLFNDQAYSGSMETLEMLIDYLPWQFPNMFQRNSSKTKITNLITGDTFDITAMNQMHPLEIASLLVQEDLVIMQRDPTEETYHANALCVCFPSGWVPRRKFELPLGSIHVPHVPFFQDKLRTSTERYFLKLKVENPVQRLNWILQVGNNLCQTSMDSFKDVVITEENASEMVYFRVERQTLRRLPKSNTILFTIKTYMTKIVDVCRDKPDIAARLAGALRQWPPEMQRYKGAPQYKEGLLAYLDQVSGSEATS